MISRNNVKIIEYSSVILRRKTVKFLITFKLHCDKDNTYLNSLESNLPFHTLITLTHSSLIDFFINSLISSRKMNNCLFGCKKINEKTPLHYYIFSSIYLMIFFK